MATIAKRSTLVGLLFGTCLGLLIGLGVSSLGKGSEASATTATSRPQPFVSEIRHDRHEWLWFRFGPDSEVLHDPDCGHPSHRGDGELKMRR